MSHFILLSSVKHIFFFHHFQQLLVQFCYLFSCRMRWQNNPYFTLLPLFISVSWGQLSNPDSERQSCQHCDLHLLCNCSFGGFTSVPAVTDRALTLDLSFNNIAEVKDDDLADHRQLRILSLQGNADGQEHLKWAEKYFWQKVLTLCQQLRLMGFVFEQ